MTYRRDPPPAPKPDPPSVLLMRAIGDLQAQDGGEMLVDIEAIALMCGIVWQELPALIEVGITAGYLDGDDTECVIGLSAKGQRWYVRDLLKRE